MSNRIVPRWVRTLMCLIAVLTIPLTIIVMLAGVQVTDRMIAAELLFNFSLAKLAFGK